MLAVHPTLSGSDGKLPIVLYQFVGAGKSMFNAVDDTWRWRFRVGDRYFGRYWIQTIRFLARSKLLGRKQAEVTTDRRRYQRNQPVQVRVRFPNPGIAPTGGEVVVQVERKGQGPAQARAEGVARHAQRLRRGPAAGRSRASTRSGSCPPPSSKARSPRPPSGSTRRPASWNACR